MPPKEIRRWVKPAVECATALHMVRLLLRSACESPPVKLPCGNGWVSAAETDALYAACILYCR